VRLNRAVSFQAILGGSDFDWKNETCFTVLLSVFVSISLLLVYMFLSNPAVQETFSLAFSEEATSVLNLTPGEHVSIWLSTVPPGMSGRSAQEYVIKFYATDPDARTVLNATGTVRTGLLYPLSFVAQQSGVYTLHFKNSLGGSFIKTVSLSYRVTHSIYGIPIEHLLLFALAATTVPIVILGVTMLRKRGTHAH